MTAILVIGFIVLYVLFYFLGLLFKTIIAEIKTRLTEKSLLTLKIIGTILDYLLTIALGMILYYSWRENNISAIGFFGAFLILQIINIPRNEKLATKL